MNTPHSSLLRRLAAITLLLSLTGILAESARGQGSVRNTLESQGAGWLVGTWTGTNAQGMEIELEYEWELGGYALEIELAMADAEYGGIIARDPASGVLTEFGSDTQGSITRATWHVRGESIVSERAATRPDGAIGRIAVVSKPNGSESFTATVHSLSEAGQIGDEVLDTVTMKRVTEAQDDD